MPGSMVDGIEPFVWVAEFRVVIYKQCRFTCVAHEVEAHLAAVNHRCTAAQRRIIAARVQALPGVYTSQQYVQALQFPVPTSAAIPQLQAPRA